MYIIKNAFRCIGRFKGRNILIGIIALVISVSACIGLSIRQAAESARTSALDGMRVTATISYDRTGMMEQLGGKPDGGGMPSGGFDKEQFADFMGNADALTLEEYQKYATAESVQDFYYTITAYLNGADGLSPVGAEDEDGESGTLNGTLSGGGASNEPFGMGGTMGGMANDLFASGDFSVIGYSSDSAMSDFADGTVSILSGGAMFEEGTSALVCVISEELALYNGLSVGDTLVLSNPALESECYTLTISGIYSGSANNDFSMSVFGKSQDPANRIYVSANALQAITDASAALHGDDNSADSITGTLAATYVFADADAYDAFESEVRALGLDDSYTVSSSDLTAFENSLVPLNTLSTMAGWFLLVVLLIGGSVLVVLNIFQIRERKYEVGVLTAMGMKKRKVAAQFLCEILVVTMLAVGIGALIGAVSSVPVTNALLKEQTESQSNRQNQSEQNFGRPGNMGGMSGGDIPADIPNGIGDNKNGPFGEMLNGAADYITEVHSAMNLTVVAQLLGIGLLLTLVSGAASVLFIMRYDPLKILANRD